MQRLLATLLICLTIVSCGTLKELSPKDYVYKIVKAPIAQKIMPCYYRTVQDLAQNKNLRCIENLDDLEGWLVIHPEKLKQFLTQGVDELIAIQNQEKPK